jgi:hypothetical protein
MGWPSPLDDVAPVANERTAVARSERRGGAEALAPGGLEALGRGLRVGEMGDGERELNSIRRGLGVVGLCDSCLSESLGAAAAGNYMVLEVGATCQYTGAGLADLRMRISFFRAR